MATNSISKRTKSKNSGKEISKHNSLLELLEEKNSKLKNLIDDIIDDATHHLEGARKFFEEFDYHNVNHCKAILYIIEQLLGENAEKLSSNDLFSIIAAVYLHDCGMSISVYETKVMELAEHNIGKYIKIEEARNEIIGNKEIIYPGGMNGEIKNWMFVPNKEDTLISYFSNLYQDYLDFANGYVIENNFEGSIEDARRTEFLRLTHHTRIEEYVHFLNRYDYFNKNENERLKNDIGKICRAHCENKEYVMNLDSDVSYDGVKNSNLQFFAMMLRIGDIVHFDHKRAPLVLRALQHFKSKISFGHWEIKEGVNKYVIKNHTISYVTNFKDPKYYYRFLEYVDYIDKELFLYNEIKNNWKEGYYPQINNKVDRKNIKWDENKFVPVPGLKFTLEQDKILNLLMGSNLYKNDYVCLRELYQNSLDACRCQMAKGKQSECIIIFGLGEEDGRKYLYCLDNGKGMSKEIIQNYLLKIGSSYYKSSAFKREQARTGYKFTPTSQFGIGILSCYIIGDKVEIVTKMDNTECISFIIDGISQYSYYKTTPSKDEKEMVGESGTLIKVFLKKEYINKLNNHLPNDLCYYLFAQFIRKKSDKEEIQKQSSYQKWLNSLYQIVNDFIFNIPEHIKVYVVSDKGKKIEIMNKPLVIGKTEDFKITNYEKFVKLHKQILNCGTFKRCYILNDEIIKKFVYTELKASHNGIEYITHLVLMESYFPNLMLEERSRLPVYQTRGWCIDGIKVFIEQSLSDNFIIGKMAKCGIINFFGENRPQLSVDRETVINVDLSVYDIIAKQLLRVIINQAIERIIDFINKNKITSDSLLYYYLWRQLFFRFLRFEDVLKECFDKNIEAKKMITYMKNIANNYELDNRITKGYELLIK